MSFLLPARPTRQQPRSGSAERLDVDDLMRDIERYLDAVALFRALGHEPRWRGEEFPS